MVNNFEMCLSKCSGSDSNNNKINNNVQEFIIVTEYSKTLLIKWLKAVYNTLLLL